MRATAVLQKLLQRSIPSQHAKRLATIWKRGQIYFRTLASSVHP